MFDKTWVKEGGTGPTIWQLQAGTASIVDINQAIDQLYIPFGAQMALK